MIDEFKFEIDNILANDDKKKKRKNSGAKGDRAERQLCKLLTSHFGKPFERSVGSGNRWAQVKGMSQAAKDTLLGDISCPDGFLWVLESKCGYEDKVDLHNIWIKGSRTIDDFLQQVSDDAVRSGRKPLLLYKRNLRPWLAFLRKIDRPYTFEKTIRVEVPFKYSLHYLDWMAVALDELLTVKNPRTHSDTEYWFA